MMKYKVLLTMVVLLPLLPGFSAKVKASETSADAVCPVQLESEIASIIQRPEFRHSRWGIDIETLSSQTIYSHDSDYFFIPASNAKLLTTAAILRRLGGSFQIRTSVYDVGNDDVRVVGRGDPSLSDRQLQDLAKQISDRGINQIRNLILDDSYFQGDRLNSTWALDDVQADYGTSINSLTLNQNAVDLSVSPQQVGQPLKLNWSDNIAAEQWKVINHSTTVNKSPNPVAIANVFGKPILEIRGNLAINSQPETFSLAIPDPNNYFAQHFRKALLEEGITVKNISIVSTPTNYQKQEIAFVESSPLKTLLIETNQKSNNLYAEALLRSLGTTIEPQTQNSNESGLKAVKEILDIMAIDRDYLLIDSSGLSRQNLITPNVLVQVLQVMTQSPEYRNSLSLAGVNGTLQRRYENTPAQGILQGKTGTMNGTVALSGYLNVPHYQPLVFSILVNQSDQRATTIRQAVDEIVFLLIRLHSC